MLRVGEDESKGPMGLDSGRPWEEAPLELEMALWPLPQLCVLGDPLASPGWKGENFLSSGPRSLRRELLCRVCPISWCAWQAAGTGFP